MHIPALLIITALLSLAACHTAPTIYPVPRDGAQLKGNPDNVTVTRHDGTMVTIAVVFLLAAAFLSYATNPSGIH